MASSRKGNNRSIGLQCPSTTATKMHRLHSKFILPSCFVYQSSLILCCHLLFFINPLMSSFNRKLQPNTLNFQFFLFGFSSLPSCTSFNVPNSCTHFFLWSAGAPIPIYMTNTFKFPKIWNRFQKYVTDIINF